VKHNIIIIICLGIPSELARFATAIPAPAHTSFINWRVRFEHNICIILRCPHANIIYNIIICTQTHLSLFILHIVTPRTVCIMCTAAVCLAAHRSSAVHSHIGTYLYIIYIILIYNMPTRCNNMYTTR